LKDKRSFKFVIINKIFLSEKKMVENKNDMKKINEIINDLEFLKEQLNKLELKIKRINYDIDIENVFNKLRNLINESQINSVILVRNNEVKYIAKDVESNGYKTLLILEDKAYVVDNYDVLKDKVMLRYFYEYNIPDDILKDLEMIPESNIDYVEPKFFKLYHILKKHYHLNLIKS